MVGEGKVGLENCYFQRNGWFNMHFGVGIVSVFFHWREGQQLNLLEVSAVEEGQFSQLFQSYRGLWSAQGSSVNEPVQIRM